MILLNHVRYLDLDFVVAVFLNLRVAVKKNIILKFILNGTVFLSGPLLRQDGV